MYELGGIAVSPSLLHTQATTDLPSLLVALSEKWTGVQPHLCPLTRQAEEETVEGTSELGKQSED